MDLDKLNLIWWFNFRLDSIFATASASSKNTIHLKSSQKDPKKITLLHLSWLILNPFHKRYI